MIGNDNFGDGGHTDRICSQNTEQLVFRRSFKCGALRADVHSMLNFDPSVNAETNTINMMAAADKVSTGLITYAARDSEYDGKRIRKGEIMALENGKIVSTSNDITKATYRLARNMCKKDSSFVTIISGCDVSDEDAEKVTEIVKAKCPNHVEVSHIRGGQPVYYYMISVE